MGSREEADTLLSGQAKIWRLMFAYVDSLALRCAMELGIADIINSHGGPITLSQIASGIDSSTHVDIAHLDRIMRFLVCKEVFSAHERGDQTFYGINHHSIWLLRDSNRSLGEMAMLETHPWSLGSFQHLSQSVKEGGSPFKIAYGRGVWELTSQDPEFNKIFNDAMASTSRVMMRAFLSVYKDGFNSIESLVDVGGGTGGNLAGIVKSFPHIKGTNFDLPNVVETAPIYEGVSHVSGNMFEDIPSADAIFMKWILHNWDDESCVKILRNCHKALPKGNGKLILMEIILQPDGKGEFGDVGLAFDLQMLTLFAHGKERTELEWKKLLEEGGFSCYKIINIPALPSIIEAYPDN